MPSLGRFASADTIVPDPTNPQQFNRFSYVLNNPLKYTDPSGHWGCVADDDGQRCLDWVSDLLDMLRNGGAISQGVYLWFMQYDEVLKSQGGIGVVFEIVDSPVMDYFGTSFGMEVRGDDRIRINRTLFNEAVSSSKAALLGHEITHLYQNDSIALSKTGEIAAYFVQTSILKELGQTLNGNFLLIDQTLTNPSFNLEQDFPILKQALTQIVPTYHILPSMHGCACRSAGAVDFYRRMDVASLLVEPVKTFTNIYQNSWLVEGGQ